MNRRCLRVLFAVAVATSLTFPGCGREEPASTSPIQLVTGPSGTSAGQAALGAYPAPDGAGVIAFPPRNEPYDFRQELERKYRDGRGRSPSSTYVDIEGDIVWTQEYLRYRVNRCGHAAATSKVLAQIDGQGIAPTCWDALSGVWDGESDYFNAPFLMDLYLRGASIAGRYTDRHDAGSLWGTYAGGPVVIVNAYFGDGGIRFEGEFDGPDKIKGTMRVSTISRLFTFTMTRRP